jgi:alkylation response protein AidB-like acyl-CoA dehydrogenase
LIVNFELTDVERAFRSEVTDWLAAHVPAKPLPSVDTAEGFAAHRCWEAELAAARWSVVNWPAAYGGRDASLVEWLCFEEAYWAAGAPVRVSQNGIFLLAPTLLSFGSDEQKARFLPPMARAEQVWAQAWSEPDAGSDLASLRSRAARDEAAGGWRLSGQKTWSTRAPYADWGFGLFRTGTAEERHRGLTYFLFPLGADGVTVRPIAQLDGEPGFAEIFFDDVFVPDEQVLGEVGRGWQVAMATTSSERGLTLRSPGRFTATADRLAALLAQTADADPVLAAEVAERWIAAQAYRARTFEVAGRALRGGEVGAESSLDKLFWSELDIGLHETALGLLGGQAAAAGPWWSGFLFSLAGPIYAGTNEIQRSIVAERVLGLPR